MLTNTTSHEVYSVSAAAMTSSKRDIRPRRASSMDDHHNIIGNDGRAASGDDETMVVRSAHSSPSRVRSKFTWLRKVTVTFRPTSHSATMTDCDRFILQQFNYFTVSHNKRATLFSTKTLVILGQFL